MKFSFVKPTLPTRGAVVVGVLEKRKLPPTASALDRKASGAIGRAMKASRFEGRSRQFLSILAPAGLPFHRIVLVGLGAQKEIDELAAQALGGAVVANLNGAGETAATVFLDDLVAADQFAFGARLRAYRFDKYRTREKAKDKPSLRALTVAAAAPAAAVAAS